MIILLIEKVLTHDPDIISGFEIHKSSWGYAIERAMALGRHTTHRSRTLSNIAGYRYRSLPMYVTLAF